MFRLALKSVRHNPKRLILTAIAVALGVALVSATHIFTNSLDSGISSQFEELYADVDVVVSIPEGSDAPALPDDVPSAAAAAPGVAYAAGVNTNAVPLVLTGPATPETSEPFGPQSIGVVWTGIESVDIISVVEGRAPEGQGEALLDIAQAEKLGVSLGDTFLLGTADGTIPITVVGIGELDESIGTFGATFGAYSIEDLRAGFEAAYGYTEVYVIAADGATPETVRDAVASAVPDWTVRTADEQSRAQIESFGDFLTWIDTFTLVFAFISVFVGAYIIVNTFRVLVTQRTRELGLLRAIGATGRQVRTMVLLEALLIGAVAGVLGIVLGWLLALIIVGGLSLLGVQGTFGTVTIPVDAMVWGMSTAIIITVVSALLPAISASRISPMEALRDQATVRRRGLRGRNIVGGALTLAGLLAGAVGLYGSVEGPYWWVGAGAVAIILGVTLLTAQLLVPIAASLGSVLGRIWKVPGKLATKNIERETRRSANTAAALMIGVLLLSLTATFTESIKALVRETLVGVAESTLYVGGPSTAPTGPVVASIQGIDGVELTCRQGVVLDATLDGADAVVNVVDTATVEGTYNFEAEVPWSEVGDGALVSPHLINDRGYAVGDDITLETATGSATVEIVGVYGNNGDGDVVIDWSTAEELSDTVALSQIAITLEDGADEDAVKAAIQTMLEDKHPVYGVLSVDDLLGLVNTVVDLVLAVLYAFLAGTIIIAILGVTNTLLLSVTERTREIGLLRAVGMSRRSVRKMIRIESVVMAVLGAILGSILGVGLGVAIIKALAEFGFTVIAVPWVQMIAFTVLAVVAGILAAIWPAWRASRLDILKAIAADG